MSDDSPPSRPRILDDLVEATKPRLMTVRGIFAQRGGISLTAEARYSQNS